MLKRDAISRRAPDFEFSVCFLRGMSITIRSRRRWKEESESFTLGSISSFNLS
jgi:hypothetical protein